MCPCEAIDLGNTTLPDNGTSLGLAPQLPPFDLSLPNFPMEDLIELFNLINLIVPPGTLLPNLSPSFSKNILEAVQSLLEQFTPVLMMYTFFMPILNMILCIIEVLCALTNPFKLVRALKRLFRVCIPEFLSLFPFFALIIMILSLLLLILTLIIYLIERIIALIEQLIANINLLAEAVNTANNDSIIAITTKLGDLLCLFQNLFVVLGVIALLLQLIEQLLKLLFKIPPCDDNDGGDDGCCTPDVCPSFIRNNKEITRTTGTFQYTSNTNLVGPPVTVFRTANWQFYDASAPPELAFINIVAPTDVNPTKSFFPEGKYDAKTPVDYLPYTIDLRLFYVPSVFSRTGPSRFIRIKNCAITEPPSTDFIHPDNSHTTIPTGVLILDGGSTYEDDGVTLIPGFTGIRSIISHVDVTVLTPANGPPFFQLFQNVEYTLKINHFVLMSKSLITTACHPDLSINKNIINTAIGAQFNLNGSRLGKIKLPDAGALQAAIITSVSNFRNNVSIDNANKMQKEVVAALTATQQVTEKAVLDTVDAGFDPFKSDFSLEPSIQFITRPIDLSVSLNESSGKSIATRMPANLASQIAQKIVAEVTFGSASSFSYDGSSKFTSKITATAAGNGKVKVRYNNQFVSILHNPTDLNQLPSVETKELMYTFVASISSTDGTGTGGNGGPVETIPPHTGNANTGTGGADSDIPGISGVDGDETIRRDEGDVSRDGGNNNGD